MVVCSDCTFKMGGAREQGDFRSSKNKRQFFEWVFRVKHDGIRLQGKPGCWWEENVDPATETAGRMNTAVSAAREIPIR